MIRKTVRLMICILVLFTILAACGPSPEQQANPTPTAPPPTLAPAASPTPEKPLYAGRGKYIVGQQDYPIQIVDQTLRVTAFYPALNSEPDVANGPYPLVVFSPGMGATGVAYSDLIKPIASHGFVILTWNPRGETEKGFWQGAATRPLDLQRIIQYADELNAPGGNLAGMIDTQNIGVAGHSSGGWTALIGGGAQMDLGFCTAHPDLVAKLPISNCPEFTPHQQEIATLLGLKSAPEGLWPATDDPRVAAVIAASPDGDIWGADYQGVASVKAPTLIMAGSEDQVNIPEICAYPIYEHLGSADKTLVVFEHGDHGMSWDKYADMIQHTMTAFLLARLKGVSEAAKSLLPENVTFPGVNITTTASDTP